MARGWGQGRREVTDEQGFVFTDENVWNSVLVMVVHQEHAKNSKSCTLKQGI